MRPFGIRLSAQLESFLNSEILHVGMRQAANSKLQAQTGIVDFFGTDVDWQAFQRSADEELQADLPADRREFGDFQTNETLALAITAHLARQGYAPTALLEPTCGRGSFVLAALKTFPSLHIIYAIDIHVPYIWEAKFAILEWALATPGKHLPHIEFIHANVFEFDFQRLARTLVDADTLILGNPPWVTNAGLGQMESDNLPAKSNFKGHAGLDAMTGKGNFDIAESITHTLLHAFQAQRGKMALLLKTAVVKNIVFDQPLNGFSIGNLQQWAIDSRKEFGAATNAALFQCDFGAAPAVTCTIGDFYHSATMQSHFGWWHDKFIANIAVYEHLQKYDGRCPFEWRSGVKHDCAVVMEFDKITTDTYQNSLGESFSLENDLVYGLLKSSDLQQSVIDRARKFTLIPQEKVGAPTDYIAQSLPATHDYLTRHSGRFIARKSAIYKGKPPFSIFGIGNYAFKPYKVAISGLYKKSIFCLVLPADAKPLMLDDTCIFLGFDSLPFAVYTYLLLNSEFAQQLLAAISFPDAKRRFTKDILMRIDLGRIAEQAGPQELEAALAKVNEKLGSSVDFGEWEAYLRVLVGSK